MTYARKVDANQAEIVRAIEKIGAIVTPLYRLGHGVADLLISFRQRWCVMEVKTEDGELTSDQVRWIGKQRAPVVMVRNPMEAVYYLQRIAP